MRCPPPGLIYSKPSVVHTRRPLKASILPRRLESVFSGPAPPGRSRSLRPHFRWHTVEVRRGLDSFMSRCLPVSARLSPNILRVAIMGPIALREMELRETHRLIFGPDASHQCSSSICPSRGAVGPKIWEAHQNVIDRVMDSSGCGSKTLQIVSLSDVCSGDCYGFCENYVRGGSTGMQKF